MYNLLVIGGNGSIGKKLISNIKCKIVVNYDISNNVLDDVLDRDRLYNVIMNNNIDVICNLAAYTNIRESISNPHKYYLNNHIGMLNVLEVARLTNVKQIIFASSCSIHNEDYNAYSLSKKHSEELASMYSKYDINIICLRFYNVYGFTYIDFCTCIADDSKIPFSESFVSKAVNAILTNKSFTIDNSSRDFIHVCDVVRSIECAINISISNSNNCKYEMLVFEIGTGKTYNIRYVFNRLIEILNNKYDMTLLTYTDVNDISCMSENNIEINNNILKFRALIDIDEWINNFCVIYD